MLEVRAFACEVADQATRFGDQQCAGGHVPRLEADFKEAIAEACCHVGQVQCGSTGTAQAGGALHHIAHEAEVFVEVVVGAERKACGEQALFQAGALAHTDAAVVHVRTATLGGGEQIVACGVVNDGLFQPALHLQRNADAVEGKAMDEVGGAVQGIDDPDVVGIGVTVGGAGLFGQDAMVGVGGEQRVDDDALAVLVYLRHKVVRLLL